MIKKEDIKVGLEFVLPCELIERTKEGFLYYVNTRKGCYAALSKPTDVFRVNSVKNDRVYCDVCDVTSERVDLDILQEKGIYPEYAEKLMDEWKDSIGVDNLNWSELPFNSLIMGKQNEKTDADRFKEITDKMCDIYKQKNSDYGSSFSKLFKKCGMTYAYGHLAEKIERIDSLSNNDAKVQGESMIDSLYDLANYSILTIMEIEKRKKHGAD